MPSTTLENKLNQIFSKAIDSKIFPGACVGISFGPPQNRIEKILSYGYLQYHKSKTHFRNPVKVDENIFYDLASLTKPFATVLPTLCLVKGKKVLLTDTLDVLLREEIPPHLKNIKLVNLLGHNSGLPAHRPFFERLKDIPKENRVSSLKEMLFSEKLTYKTGSEVIYSDLGFIVLGWIIESQTGLRLDEFFKKNIMAPWGLGSNIFFNLNNNIANKVYAPTEKCHWRKKILKGQVHDDNCYTMGGVAGHAGLFGNISAVLNLCTHLLDVWQGRIVHPHFNNKDLVRMTTKQKNSDSTWGLGFDTPSKNNSSGGHNLSPKSFGHLGFTGTSFWIDPSRDTVIVLLTNRVFPDRDNDQIKKFRPIFHDTIMEWVIGNCPLMA